MCLIWSQHDCNAPSKGATISCHRQHAEQVFMNDLFLYKINPDQQTPRYTDVSADSYLQP
ncbi:MAG: hypothetical protein ACI935_001254 [Moritella dasanensis]|jgi:hypothetical protein